MSVSFSESSSDNATVVLGCQTPAWSLVKFHETEPVAPKLAPALDRMFLI